MKLAIFSHLQKNIGELAMNKQTKNGFTVFTLSLADTVGGWLKGGHQMWRHSERFHRNLQPRKIRVFGLPGATRTGKMNSIRWLARFLPERTCWKQFTAELSCDFLYPLKLMLPLFESLKAHLLEGAVESAKQKSANTRGIHLAKVSWRCALAPPKSV